MANRSNATRKRPRNNKALSPQMASIASRTNQPAVKPVPFTQTLNAMTANPATGQINPLPRDPYDENPFGPLLPLRAQPIDPVRRDTGRPEPRLSEYEVGWNLPGQGNRRVPWQVLREASRDVDVLRRCIQIRKNHVTGLKWSWTLTSEAVEQAMVDGKHTSRLDAESALRQRLLPDINRLTAFWERPWRANGLSFRQWVSLVLEEILSIDALAIYPRLTLGGDLLDLEIVDGTTIKPLRDWRGAAPVPPYPAFQQELYGFPRGEFTATIVDTPEGQLVPGAFYADQMYYYRSVAFTDTPYGMSQVEQALISARLYLMRQGWMLAEYDDGVSPNTWLVAAPEVANLGNEPFTAQKRNEWQRALNDDLAGNTRQRQRVQLTPPGFRPEFPAQVDSRYKPEYDQYLITILSSHLDVTMAELGFSLTGGLGATGFHEGQEDVQFRKATLPTCEMLQEIILDLSRMFLGAPPELTFKFLGLDEEDEAAQDALNESRVKSGRLTLNEDRDRLGKPRYTFAEADKPYLQLSRGVVFLDGASNDPTASGMTPTRPSGAGDPGDSGFTGEGGTSGDDGTQGDQGESGMTVKGGTRSQVYAQMRHNFPPKALEWVQKAKWSGPHIVDFDDIDFSSEHTWAAYHEPDKVMDFAARIRKHEHINPPVLVHTPGSQQMTVVDGHHRVLAYRAIGAHGVPAWVGSVTEKSGPWDEAHSEQYSKQPDVDAKPLTAEKLAEISAFNRWTARNRGRAKRAFGFKALTSDEALARQVITFEDIGVLASFAPAATLPKADAPAAAPSWPGWARDKAVAELYARELRDQLGAALDTAALAHAWAGIPKATHANPSAAHAFLIAHNVGVLISGVLRSLLTDLYAQGYLIGARSAAAMLNPAHADWGGWKAGDGGRARQLLADDKLTGKFLEFTTAQAPLVEQAVEHRVGALAQALADARASGGDQQAVREALDAVLADAGWSGMFTLTETTRASSSATLAVYSGRRVTGTRWLTAEDDRVCPVCDGNADAGIVPIGFTYTSGDSAPPAHPSCRCALEPVTGP